MLACTHNRVVSVEVIPLARRHIVAAAGIGALALAGGYWLAPTPDAADVQIAAFALPQCQPGDQPIDVRLEPTEFDATGALPWGAAEVRLSGIAPACVGHRFQLAVETAQGWAPLHTGELTATSVSVPVPGLDVAHAGRLAVAILPPGDTTLT